MENVKTVLKTIYSDKIGVAAAPVVAAETKPDSYETERLERSCAIGRESLLRERNGTPACDRLDRLYGRPPKAEPVVVVVPQERDRDQDWRWDEQNRRWEYRPTR